MTQPNQGAAMLELADKLEAATGPDQSLDREIAKSIGWLEVLAFGYNWQDEQGRKRNECPRYTASLDAALTLVPEGFGRVEFGRYVGDPTALEFWCQITLDNVGGVESYVEAENCATIALALCAASLRAKAAQ